MIKNNNTNLIYTNLPNSKIFNFDPYFKIFPERKTIEHYNFLCWFVGFAEGCATFYLSKQKDFPNTYIRGFQIVTIDLKILEYIKKELNLGTIYVFKQTPEYTSYTYIIQDKQSLIILIRIFSDNIQLQKTFNKIQLLHENLAKDIDFPGKLVLNPVKNKISLKNGWLSGFIDAEGDFSTYLGKSKRTKSGYNLILKVRVPQQKEKGALNTIKKLFKSQAKILDLENDNFRLQIHSKSSLNILIKYLNKFPLKTEDKILSFNNWINLTPYAQQKYLYPIVQDAEKFLELQK